MRHIPEPERDTWASLVRRHRERNQLTQQKLAERLYVTRETIGRWESGKYKPDSIDLARAAIRELGIDQEAGMRAAGYGLSETEPAPDPYAYVREMGLDPNNQVVREILALNLSEELELETLRQERENQLRDEERRMQSIRQMRRLIEGRGDLEGHGRFEGRGHRGGPPEAAEG